MPRDVMKVGELASRTGLTVRTLHHYDDIGLLRPRERTASGHRLYGLDEVRRLQQIASLRQVGLSLEEIQSCLDRPDYTLDRVLALQIQRLEGEIARQTRLMGLLRDLQRRVSHGDAVTVADVASVIEATVHYERYYTPDQLSRLEERAQTLGPGGLEEGQAAWVDLFRALEDAWKADVPPDDETVLALARKGAALIEAFTGGDPEIRASLERMYKEGAGAQVMRGHGMGVSPDVMAYFQKAMAHLKGLQT